MTDQGVLLALVDSLVAADTSIRANPTAVITASGFGRIP